MNLQVNTQPNQECVQSVPCELPPDIRFKIPFNYSVALDLIQGQSFVFYHEILKVHKIGFGPSTINSKQECCDTTKQQKRMDGI